MKNWKIFKLGIDHNKTEYQVYIRPDGNSLFFSQLDNVLEKYDLLLSYLEMTKDELVFAKIFVSDYLNQQDLMKEHPLFQDRFKNCGFSIIEQSPLDGSKINVLLWFIKGERMKKYRLENAFYLETENHLHIFHCTRNNNPCCPDLDKQTEQVFTQHKYLIQKHGMDMLNNCVRTWLYVRDIDKNYADVVKGRNNFFIENELNINTHFIASTGIEGSGESAGINLCIDLYSVKGIKQEQVKYLKALEYLNPTYEYGVSFERGVCITYPDRKHIFISGTASIDKNGNCVHKGNVISQLERVFINIRNLLYDAESDLNDISSMIIYLRDISDYTIVNEYINTHYGLIPSVIVHAKICRPKWLIEVECIALKRHIINNPY
jgi:enamine deaminase RidA (YjgF/YER057c/UK114 family)